MRLLHTRHLAVESFNDDEIPRYAALSHTWDKDEVTFQDTQGTDMTTKKGYEKLEACCSLANADGFDYVWMDTCCIDKTSSTELSEAINSMFRWYEEAEVCYVYFSDVPSRSSFVESRWFSRGWTLQELIAPPSVIFFDEEWEELGTRESLQQLVSDCTGIPEDILAGRDLETASVAQRMSWASKRQTTRIEDRAYSLLGIFGINMPLVYGEGQRAFVRLQEEIIKVVDDHSIFAWTSTEEYLKGGLLASSPDAFKDSANIIQHDPFAIASHSPLSVSSKGIHLELRYLGLHGSGLGLGILNCKEKGTSTAVLAIWLIDVFMTMEIFDRLEYDKLKSLDLAYLTPAQYPVRRICVRQPRRAHRKVSKTTFHPSENSVMPMSLDHLTEYPLEKYFFRSNHSSFKFTKEAPPPHALGQWAKKGLIGAVWLFLSRSDVLPDTMDSKGRTPLSYAAEGGHTTVVRMLLSQQEVNPDRKDGHQRTPLSYAAEWDQDSVIKLLVETGKVIVDSRDSNGWTPLVFAVRNGHLVVVQLLLDMGAKVNSRDIHDRTPLHFAAQLGNLAMTQLLITEGASISSRDMHGRTPPSYAAENGHEAIEEFLTQTMDEETSRARQIILDSRSGQGSPSYSPEDNFMDV